MVTTGGDVVSESVPKAAHNKDYLSISRSYISWFFTLDHKRIGVMYLCGMALFFLAAIVIGLLTHFDLAFPGSKLFAEKTFHTLFSLQGAIVFFLVLVPGIPAVLGNFFLPMMIGARNVAFPRLNLLGFHAYALGSIMLLGAIIAGGSESGWLFFSTYGFGKFAFTSSMIYALLGALLLSFSSALIGINFIVTIHKMRARNLTWTKLPIFPWTLYAAAIIQVFATPVLTMMAALLFFEGMAGTSLFQASAGTNALLFKYFFQFYTQPALFIILLPAFGVISEVIATNSRKRVFGYLATVISCFAIAILSFLGWGQGLITSGQSSIVAVFFSFFSLAAFIPIAIIIFNWVATLYEGSIRFSTPMLYAAGFLILFAIGIFSGLFLSNLGTGAYLQNTYFSAGHMGYLLMGGGVMAFLAGLFHWWPKVTGRQYNENLGKTSVAFVFLGVNLTFFPQFLLGAKGIPTYIHRSTQLSSDMSSVFSCNQSVSVYGSWLLGIGLLLAIVALYVAWKKGQPAESANPWGAKSMEWETTSPPLAYNFLVDPELTHGPYEYDEIDRSAEKENV